MRAVVQRVCHAKVTIANHVAAQIGPGHLVFVGVASEDGPADAECIADKVQDLRIFPDADGKMNHSIAGTGGSVLVVSQSTLQGDCRRGRRRSFDSAAPAALARALYEDLVCRLREASWRYSRVCFSPTWTWSS
jgi:D-aminoacyl-tRNA deacylase